MLYLSPSGIDTFEQLLAIPEEFALYPQIGIREF